MNKVYFTFLLLLNIALGFSQERTPLKGKVLSGSRGIANVFVINKANGTEAKTDYSGAFAIQAKPGDVLAVYNKDITVREFLLKPESFATQPYEVSVNYQPYQLDEVVIDKNITAESLGIVPRGQKKFTQQEKKLYTASYNTPLWKLALGLFAGSMPVDPFINAITGRTRMLKNSVATERTIAAIEKINDIYTNEEVIEQLKVPADYVQGFKVYAAENKAITAAFTAGDEGHAKALLATLAIQYNQLIANE